MTHHDAPGSTPAPGTVAHEAALLVDLLSQRGWGGSSRMPSGEAGGNGHSAHSAHSAASADEHLRHDGPGPGHEAPAGGSAGQPAGGSNGSNGSASECTCGGTTPAACRVCPVCQLIAFVQQVNPDTIDRVADFVGFAATALRDLATAQRDRRPTPGDERAGATHPEEPS